MYFEDAVTYFDKIVMFSRKEKQIDRLKFTDGAEADGSRAGVNSWPLIRMHLFGCYHFGVSEKFCLVVKMLTV